MSAHTAGPWRVARASLYAGNDLNVDSYEHGYVALCGKRGDEVAEANANLIAAAPDLLEILIDFASSPSIAAHHPKRLAKALAAIAKAEGEQP